MSDRRIQRVIELTGRPLLVAIIGIDAILFLPVLVLHVLRNAWRNAFEEIGPRR